MENCVFCKIIKGEIPANIIYQNDFVIVFLSLENNPLIVTKSHLKDIFELSNQVSSYIMQASTEIAKATKSALLCDGIKIVQSNGNAAGQEVFHYHMHIKPKWLNNKNKKLYTSQETSDLIKSKL